MNKGNKRNIYFTRTLMERMNAHPDVNWSQICQAAVQEWFDKRDSKYSEVKQYENINAALM